MARSLYVVAGIMILVPGLDLATNVWPIRFGDIGWRYGSVGLLSGFLLTPLLGIAMGAALAGILGHYRTLRSIGILSLLAAIVLFLATALFTLDVLQLRASVPPEGVTAFQIGAGRAWVRNLIVVGSLIWLWLGANRAAKEGMAGGGA